MKNKKREEVTKRQACEHLGALPRVFASALIDFSNGCSRAGGDVWTGVLFRSILDRSWKLF